MIRIVCDECDREDTVTMSPGDRLTMPDGWRRRTEDTRYDALTRAEVGGREEHTCPRCASKRAREALRPQEAKR